MKAQQLQVLYLPLLRAASSVSPLLATLTENTRGGDTPSRAPALSSNAAAFDFSPAIPPPPRLRPFPADQLNLHPAPQRMRHANQRPNRQIPRLILHRRNLGRAHFRPRRQFCLAQILRRPQLRDLHSQLQILKLRFHQLPELLILHLLPIEPFPPTRHFLFPSSRLKCSSMRDAAIRISSSGSCALRFTMPCSRMNTLFASPK